MKKCCMAMVIIMIGIYVLYHTVCHNNQLTKIIKENKLGHLIDKKNGSDKIKDIAKKGIGEFAKSQKLEEIPKFID
jgi:hypothetical protein